jgi:hypothetical protein
LKKLKFAKRNVKVGKHSFKTSLKRNFFFPNNRTANSRLAQLGFRAELKLGFVLGSSVFNRYFWFIKSPTERQAARR